jgi:hypothetical protein
MTTTIPQHQYLANWHDSFVNYIGSLLSVVTALMASPEANEEDKRGLDGIKKILNGRDVADVERDLAAGVVRKSTLDKIEKLNKDLADTCLEHIQMNPLVREFWKQMAHIKIERDKAVEQERLAVLQIPVIEG